MIEQARMHLEQEVNIIDTIRSRRYFMMALRHLLPQAKRNELLSRSGFVKIYPSNSSEEEEED